MVNVKCMLDNKGYENKPSGKEIGAITNRLVNSQVEISIEDLANKLVQGYTFKPSVLNGKKETDWISQQLFALDFDENTTIDTELKRCKELNILPCFIYTSFSHIENHHKFRMVFCSDTVITDYDKALKFQLTLMQIFNNCDEKCKNLSRLYFGGRNLIYNQFDNRVNINEIINKYPLKEVINVKSNKVKECDGEKNRIYNTQKQCKTNDTYSNPYVKAIQNLDSKAIRTLIISRLCSEEVFGGLIEVDTYSLSISPLFLQPCKFTEDKEIKDVIYANNRQDVYEIINNINIKYFLGIDNNIDFFNCILPFHNETTPSAHIYITDSGIPIYKCFGCEFTGTIIKLVEKLAKCNKVKAINFIKEVYNIELNQSEWQKQQIEIIDTNIDYLLNPEILEMDYPELYKRIKNKIERLIVLLQLSKTNIYDEDMSYNDKSVFFVSLTKLMKLFNIKSKDSVNNDINLFTLLNLIEKLPEENIPDLMLKKAKHYSALKGYKKIPNHYIVPSYDENTLGQSEKMAITLKENNFTMKGLSKEYLIRTFGIEETNRVYPLSQFENKKGTSKKSDERTDIITKLIFSILEEKNYCIEKEIVEKLRFQYGKTRTEKQIKRSIQEILDKYDLKRIRCNKLIKEQYGVANEGYPFIIVRK